MNVLFLTPDAVGGTFLKQMLAVYMHLHEFDRPVIDIGHIELGLETYYSPEFGQKIISSTNDVNFKEMQSLQEIQTILESVDHYKLVKLPHYNICARQDPIKEQVPFYRYLNENYFIIACRRNNVFEHALSWALNKITKTLNVFDVDQKISTFAEMYRHGINIDPLSMKQALDTYKKYIQWSETNFRISSYYCYEKHSPNIEQYLLSLPIFATQKKLITWEEKFSISAADWNRCHYYLSDIGTLALNNHAALSALPDSSKLLVDAQSLVTETQHSWDQFVKSYNSVADPSWPKVSNLNDWERLPESIKNECDTVHGITYHLEGVYINKNLLVNGPPTAGKIAGDFAPVKHAILESHKAFLTNKLSSYQAVDSTVKQLIKLGSLSNSIPIKKQTLAEKKHIIKNFTECLDLYNQWANSNPDIATQISNNSIIESTQQEQEQWFDSTPNVRLLNNGTFDQ